MTIHIFGDSFACTCDFNGQSDWYTSESDKTCCWPHQLSKLKKEQLTCHAMAGSGPNFTLKRFVSFLEEDKWIKDFDTVVMCLSDQKRLEFSFLKNKPWDSAYGIFQIAEDDYEGDESFLERTKYNMNNDWREILEHNKEIKTIAQTLGPMFLYENVKNITFLHLIANNFKKIRFIVFTCFSLEHYLSYYKNFNIKSTKLLDTLTFDSLNTDNFDYVKIPIGHIVGQYKHQEALDEDFPPPYFLEGAKRVTLINHMTEEQNTKFAQLVYDVIMYNEIDKSWFVKDGPYDDPIEMSRKMEPLFIYE
jgi:hypothetical protein